MQLDCFGEWQSGNGHNTGTRGLWHTGQVESRVVIVQFTGPVSFDKCLYQVERIVSERLGDKTEMATE